MLPQRLERLKQIIIVKLNNLKDIQAKPEQIELGILEVEQVIKNYCNLDKVPEDLDYTICNMVVDLLRYYWKLWEEDEGEFDITKISNLKVGRVEVAQGSSVDTESSTHTADLDKLLMNYISQLNSFRRLVW